MNNPPTDARFTHLEGDPIESRSRYRRYRILRQISCCVIVIFSVLGSETEYPECTLHLNALLVWG